MATRKPLVLVDGHVHQLPEGDQIDGSDSPFVVLEATAIQPGKVLTKSSFNYITSDLLGAAELTNTPGSLLDVLKMVLEDGLGLSSVSGISVADGVVTIQTPGAPVALEAGLIELSGITGELSYLNGAHRVESLGTNSIVCHTTIADGSTTAAGITVRIPPLGWRRAFSSGNVSAYDSPSPKWQGAFVRFDDSAANTCLIRAYESMSDVNTGVNPFPSFAQRSDTAFYLLKYSAGTGPRKWAVWGNETFFAIGIAPWSSSAANINGLGWMYFGLPHGIAPGDAYATILKANSNVNAWTSFAGADTASNPLYMARKFAGTVPSTLVLGYQPGGNNLSSSSGALAWLPSVAQEDKNSGLLFDHPIAIVGFSGEGFRGILPGVRYIPHTRIAEMFAPYQVVRRPNGKKMVFFRVGSQISSTDMAQHGGAFVEVDGWEDA